MTIQKIKKKLEEAGYFASDEIAYAVDAAINENDPTPLLITGQPGSGKTSLAKAVAEMLGLELIRIQMYEGVRASDILYDYDYQRQLLTINALHPVIKENLGQADIQTAVKQISKEINFFDEDFLIQRPLLKSLMSDKRKVILIDEIDKANEELEFVLLEMLSEYSISIPQYKTIECDPNKRPFVFLTSNESRELSGALKRRCAFLYIELQNKEEIKRILSSKLSDDDIDEDFIENVAEYVRKIRKQGLKQQPSISEVLKWSKYVLDRLGTDAFEKEELKLTLNNLLKNKTDVSAAKKLLK